MKIGKYTVVFPIKKGVYADTYRVTDDLGKKYFLKLINHAKLSQNQFSHSCNGITELEIMECIKHPNIINTKEVGDVVMDGQKYSYVVCDFIAGETLYDKVTREKRCSVYDIKQVVSGLLNALKYLHQCNPPIIHNDVSARNIMLDMSKTPCVPILIDFGHAKKLTAEPCQLYIEGLNAFYLASEVFNGVYSTRTDLYAVGALMYFLLYGIMPWQVDLSGVPTDQRVKKILDARKEPLKIPEIDIFELNEDLLNIIAKALNQDVDLRFQSANEFLLALNGEITVRGSKYEKVNVVKKEANSQKVEQAIIKKGNGFSDVAGLEELKTRLQKEVIDLLRNPERYKKLRVKIPNGILFYGPPGCGKTFIAEKFAEELGCSYMYVHCSDVASPYIHGGQEKIAALFAKAKEQAPTVLFLDEIDAMIADRSRHNNVSEYGEVNEFLTHLNNCADNKIIVIGATNNPKGIDPAALRSGRMDIKVYVPAPDFKTRKKLLQLYLEDIDAPDIDYDELANKTAGFVSKDIAVLVNKASLLAAQADAEKVEMSMLTNALDSCKGELPSVSSSTLAQFEKIKEEFEDKNSNNQRRPIGFR